MATEKSGLSANLDLQEGLTEAIPIQAANHKPHDGGLGFRVWGLGFRILGLQVREACAK